MESYSDKTESYLDELKSHSRAAISAFNALKGSQSQVSLNLCIKKFLIECEGISTILWSSNNKKLRKHIRSVLSISSDSPLSPVAFSRFKLVIKETGKAKVTGKIGRKDKIPKDKGIWCDQDENTDTKGFNSEELTEFSYNPETKILSFGTKNYEILPLLLAVMDLYATLPFFKELQQCVEILEMNPEDSTALFQKSVLFYKARRYEAALKLTSRILEVVPEDYRVWYNRGVILEEMGRLEEALEAYNKAIDLEPTFEIPWDNKGVVLARLGRLEEALENYEQILLRNPRYAEAWAGKASVLATLDRKEEALEAYGKALEIRPDYLEAQISTCNLLSSLCRFEDALKAYDRTLQLAPKEPGVWAGRSLVLLELQRYEEALQSCNKALGLNPGFIPALEIKLKVISEISRHEKSSK